MTTLYRPVLIESAEQAEALPVGTVARTDVGDWHDAAVKTSVGVWREASSEWTSGDASMLGYTALVPIEAEEEWTRPVQLYNSTVHVAPSSGATKPSRRLVTPWEPQEPTQD